MTHVPHGPYERFFKRPLDLLLSLAACILLSPVFLLLAILIRFKLGSPVLFTQDRIGRGENVFRLFKFRSMTDKRGPDGALLPDEDRLTPFGRALRASSLDELPELFNVLKGDMSLVGPRPLLVPYLPYFRDEERIIHSVRGGLLPPDVLALRPVFDWDEQFQREMAYAKRITFFGDLRIVAATFFVVFVRRHQGGYAQVHRKSLIATRSTPPPEARP